MAGHANFHGAGFEAENVVLKRIGPNERRVDDFELAFSRERRLLEQYYAIRQHCYRNVENGPAEFDGREDFYDRISDILIVKHAGEVVGGARIVGRPRNVSIPLPLEQDGVSISKSLPEFNLDRLACCEFGRLAILDEYRSKVLLKEVVRSLIQRAIYRSYDYLIALSPLVQARCYRIICHNLKLPYPYLIHNGINVNKSELECGNLKMYLATLRLPKHF